MKCLAIIPCAGLGSRMNMKSCESKEMLIDPITNKPLIQWTLDLCKKYNIKPLIITRKEKTDLIEYVFKHTNAELMVLNEIKGEWPNTILRSKIKWLDYNILMLPDTRFNPTNVLKDIKKLLNKSDVVFALHKVEDISKWGAVDYISPSAVYYCEKPEQKVKGDAWGLIGFKKKYGEVLFRQMEQRGIWYKNLTAFRLMKKGYPLVFNKVNLKMFKDITRTGKIESYE